jgi:hypothetical protein
MEEKKGIGSAMTTEDRLQCYFRVLVECRWVGSTWEAGMSNVGANIDVFATYSPSRGQTVRRLVKTAIVFLVRHLGDGK